MENKERYLQCASIIKKCNSIRCLSENITSKCPNAYIIRINLHEAFISPHHISLSASSLKALKKIEELL